jgi:hypothetical protein
VGTGGTILHTTNAGTTWTSQTSGTTNPLTGISFADANTGTAVGSVMGQILRTTNGGATWTSQTSGTTNSLYGVSFTDVSTGTVVGFSGTILRTTNGGATWTSQSSGTNPLQGVYFTNASTGTAVGAAGTILHTTTGGITWVQEDLNGQIPGTIVLEQNYPNPFNPATTISFSLSAKSLVSLKVFDLLGREVSLILSEELPAGKYSQQWSATGLSSGVYFYRLQSGSFGQTMRLVLLK